MPIDALPDGKFCAARQSFMDFLNYMVMGTPDKARNSTTSVQ